MGVWIFNSYRFLLLPLEGNVNNAFFTSDLFRFGSTLLGIIVSSWVIISRLKERTRGKVFEVIAMVTFGIGGFASITSFIAHFFFSDMVASSIGWPLGSPFQKEVAGANLAVGLLGFLGFLAAGLLASLCDFQDRFPLDSRHRPCG